MATPLNQPQAFAKPIGDVGGTPQVALNAGGGAPLLAPKANVAAQKFTQLAKAFGQFEQGFGELAATGRQEVIQSEQERALQDTIQREGAQPVLTGEESAWYADTSMALYGQRAAADALTDLNTRIAELQDKPDELRNLDPRKFLDDWSKENIAGIDDPIVAKQVYGAVQNAVPGHISGLASAKRRQLEADRKAAEQERLDAGHSLAHSMMPSLASVTPENLWGAGGVFKQLTGLGIGEKEAAGMIVQAYQDVVKGRGDVSSPAEFDQASAAINSKNPEKTRGGANFSIYEYLGSDKSSADTLTNASNYARNESQRIVEAERARAEAAQNYASTQYLASIKNNIIADPNYMPTQDALAPLSQTQLGEVLPLMKSREVEKIDTQQYDSAIVAQGADRTLGDTSKLQDAFTKRIVGFIQATPFDPKNPQTWIKGVLQPSLDLRQANNTKMSLGVLTGQINNAWMEEPDAASGAIGVRTQKLLSVYGLVHNNKNYFGMEAELLSEKDRAYAESINQKLNIEGLTLPQAVAAARREMSDEGQTLAKRWLDGDQFNPGNRRKAEDAAVSALDSNITPFDQYDKDMQARIRTYASKWFNTAALTVRDPKLLGENFAKHMRNNTVTVEDTDTGMMGFRREKLFMLPRTANGAVGFDSTSAESVPLEPREYGYAIKLFQDVFNKQMNEEATPGSGKSNGKYRFMPDFENPQQILVYKDGLPTGQVLPAQIVWDTYAAGVDKKPLVGDKKFSIQSKGQIEAKVDALIRSRYQRDESAREASAAQVEAPMQLIPEKLKNSVNLKDSLNINIPVLPPATMAAPGGGGIPRTARMLDIPPPPAGSPKLVAPLEYVEPTASSKKKKK